mgnify:FL=1|jgi:hypothetical protein
MKIKVKRTDKRHTAFNRFKYYVEIKHDDWNERHNVREKFFELRLWCWETWGPSREVDQYSLGFENTSDRNIHWGWLNDQYRARLYLGGPEDAAFFTLKWS